MDPETPSVLYHYTDAQGLLGILAHKQFWLTHHSFLNDSNEIQYGTKLIKQIVPGFSASIPQDSFEDWLENFDTREERSKDQTYIVCFSENGDQLSQWRAYADDGLGFAIGFRFTELEQLAGTVGWCFGPDRAYVGGDWHRFLGKSARHCDGFGQRSFAGVSSLASCS